jgi:methylmalonyl-CoA/ethylmalonyl-CoA epimerase
MQQDPLSVAMTFHHVGIGVTEFAPAIALYERLGHRLLQCVADEGLGVWVAFLAPPQSSLPTIEILAPLGPATPLAGLIKRRVLPAPYHTGYGVADLAAAAERLRGEDFLPVSGPTPAVALGGISVAFFYNQTIGLVELLESPPDFPTPSEADRRRFAAALQAGQ